MGEGEYVFFFFFFSPAVLILFYSTPVAGVTILNAHAITEVRSLSTNTIIELILICLLASSTSVAAFEPQ